MTTTEKLTPAETAREIRKMLAIAFPGVKFSLRCSRGTGWGWYDLAWTGGPADNDVFGFCKAFADANRLGGRYSIYGINTCRRSA